MKIRLKQLRDELNLSQESFGSRIKVRRSHISSLENGTRNITDRVISDICREFSVSETWLRTGKGEMFVQSETFSLDTYAKKQNLDDFDYKIIKHYILLDPTQRKIIQSFFSLKE